VSQIAHEWLGKHAIHLGCRDGAGVFPSSLHDMILWIEIARLATEISGALALYGTRRSLQRLYLHDHALSEEAIEIGNLELLGLSFFPCMFFEFVAFRGAIIVGQEDRRAASCGQPDLQVSSRFLQTVKIMTLSLTWGYPNQYRFDSSYSGPRQLD
jgi:hypothetical protein